MFKAGDRLICINNNSTTLEFNKSYIVDSIDKRGYVCVNPYIYDRRTNGYLNSCRFKYDEVYYRKLKIEKLNRTISSEFN